MSVLHSLSKNKDKPRVMKAYKINSNIPKEQIPNPLLSKHERVISIITVWHWCISQSEKRAYDETIKGIWSFPYYVCVKTIPYQSKWCNLKKWSKNLDFKITIFKYLNPNNYNVNIFLVLYIFFAITSCPSRYNVF